MERMLGIDYGEKRIGLAVCDPSGTVATPWRVVEVTSNSAALNALVEAVAESKAKRVVIGLPIRMNGQEGPAAEKARALGERLAARISIPIVYWDERFSTLSAQQVLIAGGARRDKRKQVVDKLAAQIILQDYLDAAAFQANDSL